MNEEPVGSFTDLAVAVGRIEEKVSRLDSIEQRLRHVEITTEVLSASRPTRTPWYTIIGALASTVTGVGALIALITVLNQLTDLPR